MERGISNPSTAHLIKLADTLGVSFEWLATGKENTKLDNTMLDETMQNIKINEVLNNLDREQKHYLLHF
jgi:transcriptional regulator with XRE-family HTH domain